MADEMEDTPATRKKKETTPGVIYMSRLPPFMKPAKIRNIFSQYGEVGRLFLQPEGIYEIGLSLISVISTTMCLTTFLRIFPPLGLYSQYSLNKG